VRWTSPIVVALLVAGRTGWAQSPDLSGMGLQACLQAARLADDTCAKLVDDPVARIACFQNARGSELECLEHALSDAPAEATGQATPSASAVPEQPGQPSPTPSPDVAAKAETPKAQAPAGPLEPPTGSVSGNEPQAAPPTDQEPGQTPVQAPAQKAEVPATRPAEVPGAAARSSEPDRAGLRQSGWVVSETSSPVDYSPLLTAAIRPASRLQDGPSSLTVGCRRGRTELSIWNDNGWRSTRSDAVLVDYRVDKEPIVRLMWTLSADAKTATYKDDAVDLLRSLPEGAVLSISVSDGDNARHEATFLLNGWMPIRQKIGQLCKWPAARATYGRR
jgi:hypothetical protein